jgi:hypothetical protein
MIAALMVLASHSFAIATGDVNREPLRLWLGVTPGTIAVDIFFLCSADCWSPKAWSAMRTDTASPEPAFSGFGLD